MKKSEQLLKAMTDIDDSFIQEATVETFKTKKNYSFASLLKWSPALAVVLVAVLITGGINKNNNLTIVNPQVNYEILSEAENAAGFPLGIPEEFNGAKYSDIVVIDEKVIRVTYNDGDKPVLIVTKGLGSDDVSGDYNSYPEINQREYKGFEITTKGKDDKIYLATWITDRYSFALSIPDGLDYLELKSLFDEIH